MQDGRLMNGASARRGAQEQTLHRFHMPAVGKKEDDVVVGLHDGVMVGHDDLIAPYDSADGGAFREPDFLDALAHDS